MSDELRVDAALAHPPCDQLCVLPAEVEDEDGAFLLGRSRELNDVRRLSGDSSAPLS
jgi:hypothetical protein